MKPANLVDGITHNPRTPYSTDRVHSRIREELSEFRATAGSLAGVTPGKEGCALEHLHGIAQAWHLFQMAPDDVASSAAFAVLKSRINRGHAYLRDIEK